MLLHPTPSITVPLSACTAGILALSRAQVLPPNPCPVASCIPGATICEEDPCAGRSCPLYPDAFCCGFRCGGCSHIFMTANNVDVTRDCAQSKLLQLSYAYSYLNSTQLGASKCISMHVWVC